MRAFHCLIIVIAFAPAVRAQGEKMLINSAGMKLVRIEPGAFTMGAGDAPPTSRAEWLERDHDETPAHGVKISSAFYLGVHEVTNAQYEAFDPKHKARRGQRNGSLHEDDPVVHVSWHDAMAFCEWLSKKEGK